VIRGLYSAAAGLVAASAAEDVLAANLANADTPGFKQARPLQGAFAGMYLQRLTAAEAVPVGAIGFGPQMAETPIDFRPGPLQATGNPLGAAVDGPGFFVVQTPAGVRYTRAGDFTVDAQGRLVTRQGYPVLDQQGAPVNVGRDPAHLNADGTVVGPGGPVARLALAVPSNPGALRPVGEGLYQDTGGAGMAPASAVLRPGFLEASNVDVVVQMTRLLAVARSFETSQALVRAADQTLADTVERVGRLA
jgi:flagellar basal-body rod protein FlgF